MRLLQFVRLTPCLAILALAAPAVAQMATPAAPAAPATPQFASPAASPAAKVTQTVGLTEMSVTYSRPAVKGRVIWGELVPYDKPWRTGANSPNQFTTADETTVEGQKLAAGTYSIITIPSKDSWTVAFSSQKDLQGSDNYDAKQDALRVTVKPVATTESVERMQFTFDDVTNDAATLTLRWEKVAVPLKLTVDTNGKALATARAAIAAAKPEDWRTLYRAANWAHDAGVAKDEASQWASDAAKRKDNFHTAGLLARMAQKNGDMKNAVTLMKKSITYGKADTTLFPGQLAGNEKMLEEWTATAKKK